MMTRCVLLAVGVLFVLCGFARAGDEYQVRGERPRIYFTPEDLPRLQARMKDPAFADGFAELKRYVLASTPGSNMWLNPHTADAA